MFARTCNKFSDYSYAESRKLSAKELEARMDHMQDVIFPEIAASMRRYQDRLMEQFATKHRKGQAHSRIKHTIPTGAYVMTVPDVRTQKAQARYEGPFKVVRRTRGGTYQLLDADGTLLPRNYAPSQLKVVSDDTSFAPTAAVLAILDHRTVHGQHEYLTQWHDSTTSWVPYADFQDTELIRAYHVAHPRISITLPAQNPEGGVVS
jgi:hypothetical protein